MQNVEQVAEDYVVYKENICKKLRELQIIIDNKATPPKDKIKAIQQYLDVSEKLVNLKSPLLYLESGERIQNDAEERRDHKKRVEEFRRAHQNEAS